MKTISQINARKREIQIEQRVKELFKVSEPERRENPKRTALKLAASRSASHLKMHLKISQSKKNLIETVKKKPDRLQQVFTALEQKKKNPDQRRTLNKSSKQRVRDNFKDFKF